MVVNEIGWFGAGIAVTYMFYLNWRMRRLEEVVATFPDMDEIVREVLSAKVSPDELPPEVAAAFANLTGGAPPGKPGDKTPDTSYFG